MMNLCDSTPQCLAQLRVLLTKSLQHLYEQQYQIEPPHRATRVRDLTFLPHLLELGKPLKYITMQDIVSKLPNGNQPNQATLLQQQLEMLDQPEWYHQGETQVLRRLADGRHDPASRGETPVGGSPPAGSEHVPRETSETQQPNPPRGEHAQWWLPPDEAAPGEDPGSVVEQLRGRLPAGGPPRAPQYCKRASCGGPPPAEQAQARSTPPSHATATDPLTDLIIHTAQQLHAFRQDHKQQQPTNLRTVTTWNVGGWTQPANQGDEKLRAIKACLMRGPATGVKNKPPKSPP